MDIDSMLREWIDYAQENYKIILGILGFGLAYAFYKLVSSIWIR